MGCLLIKKITYSAITLTAYQGRRKKKIKFIASKSGCITLKKGRLKVIKFYNSTKYGVDVWDQMA